MAFDRRPDPDPGRARVGSRAYSGRFDAVVSLVPTIVRQ
jgi:hypothetical protein